MEEASIVKSGESTNAFDGKMKIFELSSQLAKTIIFSHPLKKIMIKIQSFMTNYLKLVLMLTFFGISCSDLVGRPAT